jgi:hypothetical protein
MRLFSSILLGPVLLLSATVTPGRAAADTLDQDAIEGPTRSAPSVWERRRLSYAVQIGIQSPGGFLGVEAEYAPLRWLAIGGGAGPAVMGDLKPGVQAGLWVAPRCALASSAFGADVGMSAGPYRQHSFMDEHGPWKRYDVAVWFNVAARYQYLAAGGFSFRAFLGVATLTNAPQGECSDGYESSDCSSLTLGYGGVAFGYAFEPAEG